MPDPNILEMLQAMWNKPTATERSHIALAPMTSPSDDVTIAGRATEPDLKARLRAAWTRSSTGTEVVAHANLALPRTPAPIRPVFIDIETQSCCDISVVGGRRYAYDPSTKLVSVVAMLDNVMVVWAPNRELPIETESLWPERISPKLPLRLFCGGDIPDVLADAVRAGRPLCAHNAYGFDAHVWRAQGLPVPPEQLLPFFLAARSAVNPSQDLLGEALCSSYEAFRFTRHNRDAAKDTEEVLPEASADLSHTRWYLNEFDQALEKCSGATHPKVGVTVKKVVDLWEAGEKVLVFAFYRQTCRALRIHISNEIERRMMLTGLRRLLAAGIDGDRQAVRRSIRQVQKRYFDVAASPGRKSMDAALEKILKARTASLKGVQMSEEQCKVLKEVMRRFLRVSTTLVRCFPITELESISPEDAVASTLDQIDGSGISWRQKLNNFIEFLTEQCSTAERELYLEAARQTQTGGIRVEDDERSDASKGAVTLANVQVATGTTHRTARARLMRAFNTPFFPDILVCSQVMGEGVDLQRFCRHVIHHDLDWNPSTIEQRTGRIDRLGCKAESRHSIAVYLPYLAGTADERQYCVMTDRERWFQVVMGKDTVAKLITPESGIGVLLPKSVADELSFELGLRL